jgi:hypothetical protein
VTMGWLVKVGGVIVLLELLELLVTKLKY